LEENPRLPDLAMELRLVWPDYLGARSVCVLVHTPGLLLLTDPEAVFGNPETDIQPPRGILQFDRSLHFTLFSF